MGQMEQDHILPTTASTHVEEAQSSAPASLPVSLHALPRLIPNGPAHPTDQGEQAKAHVPLRRTILWLVQATTTVAPQVVGVRDQERGRSRVFTVYHPASGRAPEDDPPPDPDLPPAGPAQSRSPTWLESATEQAPDDWPHTRAA
ncbi:MAG TPA: hypothetical protein VF739_02680 [Ktedonobacterales bacterium]